MRRLPNVTSLALTIAVVALLGAAFSTVVSHPDAAGAAVAPASTSQASVLPSSVSALSDESSSSGGHAIVSAAAASLAAGNGPAAGRPWSCPLKSSDSFTCSSTLPIPQPASRSTNVIHTGETSAPKVANERLSPASIPSPKQLPASDFSNAGAHPTPASGVQPSVVGTEAWYNQTDTLNGFDQLGPTEYDGAAAYDPALTEVVLFGGCSYVCPQNATWVYNGEEWYNVTSYVFGYIPAVMGESLVWDPAWNAVLSIGGVSAANLTVNWTFAFYGDEWLYLNPYIGNVTNDYGVAWSSAAWDGALHEVVLVNGCLDSDCSAVWTGTWVLPGFLDDWYVNDSGPLIGQGWNGIWNASLAYDVAAQEIVYFGGISIYAGLINETYVFTATGWTNATTTTTNGLCWIFPANCYPSPRWDASMTWDGQFDELVLVGGENYSGLTTDTWIFTGGVWYDSAGIGSIASPTPGVGFAMPSNSSDIAPLLQGGWCVTTWCFNSSWVFEVPPAPVINLVSPSPSDVGVAVDISAGVTEGTGSGPNWTWYLYDDGPNFVGGTATDENFSTSLTFAATFGYTASGTYEITAWVYDFFWIYNSTTVDLTVNPAISLSPSVSPAPTEVGVPATFDAGASGGTGTLSYLWDFGDGTPAAVASATPSHDYETSGTFDGWVNATDGVGGWANASFAVVVNPHVTASISTPLTAIGTDLSKQPVSFTGSAADGVGSDTFAWAFGDSTTGTGATQSHTYAAAGTYTVTLTVTDGLGATATATFSVKINADLGGTVTASTLTPTTGSSVTFTATPSGGTGTIAYAWSGLPTGCTAGNVATFTCSPNTAGTYTVSVVLTDQAGETVTKTLTETVSKAAATVLGLPASTGYAVIGAIVAVIVIAGIAAALLMRRKKSRSPPGPLTPAQTGTEAPGSTTGSTPGSPPGGSPPPGAG